MSDREWGEIGVRLSTVFQPATPISRADLFAGRIVERQRIFDAVTQAGRHALIYGDRGVGKTSLANMIGSELLATDSRPFLLRVNCSSSDTFSTIWSQLLERLAIELVRAGRRHDEPVDDFSEYSPRIASLLSHLEQGTASEIGIDDVRRLLEEVGGTADNPSALVVAVIDEFDVVGDYEVRSAMADLIKYLSDRALAASVVLIGVADDASVLLENHRSVERCLSQILVPRMKRDELDTVVVEGLRRFEMTIAPDALAVISRIARGLPHYAHVLGLTSSRAAVARRSTQVNLPDVGNGLNAALDEVQASIQREYETAVTSARSDAKYRPVLLAAALAKTDSVGRFYAKALQQPLATIWNEESVSVDKFARHLTKFCDESRGPVLEKDDSSGRPRYRFTNAMLQPFVLMNGIRERLITPADLSDDVDEQPPAPPLFT